MSTASIPRGSDAIARELRRIVGDAHAGAPAPTDLHDAALSRGLKGTADAAVSPADPLEVAEVVRWCYDHDVPIVPRGGGTGYAGGATPDGGVVLKLDRLDALRGLHPEQWRAEAEAGVKLATLRRKARESGLLFPPDPGAAEDSNVGGAIATNAGGPHAFRYGVTRHWVMGVEAVVAPGELVTLGGPVRKDVAGYDLVGLLTGSEGTLGIITAAHMRLTPAPELALPVAAVFAGTAEGAEAVASVYAAGIEAAALEYFDRGAVQAAKGAFPVDLPDDAGFLVLAEADGSAAEARARRDELVELFGDAVVHAPDALGDVEALWRWREGASLAVTAQRGGKLGEDVAVPLEHLGEAVDEVVAIGDRHGLTAVSWGHAGDGNLHAKFLLDPDDAAERARAEEAAVELFALAGRLGGTVTGEHGVGLVKSGHLRGTMWGDAEARLHDAVKHALDPKGLLNPGKKRP